MIKIGIMQGRLSPSPDGCLQFFPKDWAAEFPLAKELGFNSIEWLFDWRDYNKNPVITNARDEVKSTSDKAGIKISSVCADYFMKHNFLGRADQSVLILNELIFAAHLLGAEIVVLSFLEEVAIKSRNEEKDVVRNISRIKNCCELSGVKLALETELPAYRLKNFLGKFDSSYIGVCYDLGNTASYGFNSVEEIRELGDLIFEVHIKDRKVGSAQSVYLGEGDVDFDGCFRALRNTGFDGPMILQAFRGENYVADAKRQLEFVKSKMEVLW